jgi:hypothetical protein
MACRCACTIYRLRSKSLAPGSWQGDHFARKQTVRKLILFSVALALSTPALARADSVMPRFNVTQTCHATSNLGVGDEQSFAVCMRDEIEVEKQLANTWTSYSSAARSRCSAETMIGGNPSYVELFTCLDIDRSLSSDKAPGAGK